MPSQSQAKAEALALTVGQQAQTLRALLARNPGTRVVQTIRKVLEAHEAYVAACENELVERKVAKRPVDR